MANTNISNRMNVSITTSDFRDRSGNRGRPQKNPRVILDLSGAENLVGEVGEKRVRLAAFEAMRSTLGVDSGCVVAEHPKDDCWILKSEALGKVDISVSVTEIVPTEDAPTESAEQA